MSLVSHLPPLPPPSPHFSSTDRNLPVADSHVLATQINIAFLPISFAGVGESATPCILPPLKSLWDLVLTCPTAAGSVATQGAQAEPTCTVVPLTGRRNAPPGPVSSSCNFPPHLVSGGVMFSQGWAGDFFLK